MNKKYIVRLADQERDELAAVIKKFKGASQKVRRARILSKADADGLNWTDRRICEAFGCRIRTVEKLRQRLVECGFRDTLDGARRELPPVEVTDKRFVSCCSGFSGDRSHPMSELSVQKSRSRGYGFSTADPRISLGHDPS